jgi:hypothetical protein
MAENLFRLEEKEGIIIEWSDFAAPLEAVYSAMLGLPPLIRLAKSLEKAPLTYLRCVLAEELGHHFTSLGCQIPRTFFH